MEETSYPNILIFRDSRVTWLLMSFVWAGICAVVAFTYVTGGKADLNAVLMCTGILALILLFTFTPPTVSVLNPEGVKIKAAFSQPIFRKWEDIDDLRIYKARWRRFVTYQDPSKKLQKHVFLVPINFRSKPKKVLKTVKVYQEAALTDRT